MSNSRPIILLAIGQTLVWACLYYTFPALLLVWEADFGWSRSDLTLGIGIAVLASGLTAPLAGQAIDRGDGAKLMVSAALLGALGLVALSMATQIWQFYGIWATIGVAMSGALYEPCFAIVTRARGANAKAAITAITLVAGLAGTISFPLSNLSADIFGWRLTILFAAGVVAFIAAPILWFGIKALGEANTTPTDEPETQRRFLRRPTFWLLAMTFMCVALIHGSVLHHLLPFFAERDFPDRTALTVASLIGPMQVTGRIVIATAGRNLSNRATILMVFALLAVSVWILGQTNGPGVGPYVFVVLFGTSYGTVSILRPIIAREVLGAANFGAKSGSLSMFYMIAAASAPFLGSLIWAASGYALMLNIAMALAGFGALMYFIASTSKR